MADPSATPSPSATASLISSGPTPSGYNISQTRPDKLIRHDLSDEELGELAGMRREYLWEGMWGAAGAALGSAPGAIAALLNRYSGETPVPISAGDLVQIIILFVGFAIAAILGILVGSRGKGAVRLLDKIRARPPHNVTG